MINLALTMRTANNPLNGISQSDGETNVEHNQTSGCNEYIVYVRQHCYMVGGASNTSMSVGQVNDNAIIGACESILTTSSCASWCFRLWFDALVGICPALCVLFAGFQSAVRKYEVLWLNWRLWFDYYELDEWDILSVNEKYVLKHLMCKRWRVISRHYPFMRSCFAEKWLNRVFCSVNQICMNEWGHLIYLHPIWGEIL